MKDINLIPQSYFDAKKTQKIRKIAIYIAFIIIIFLIFVYVFMQFKIKKLSNDIISSDEIIQSKNNDFIIEELNNTKQENDILEKKLGQIESIIILNDKPTEIIEYIDYILPYQMYVDQIQYQNKNFILYMKSESLVQITQFIDKLNDAQIFEQINMSSIKKEKENYYFFSLELRMKNGSGINSELKSKLGSESSDKNQITR